jgi:hypothetical protein
MRNWLLVLLAACGTNSTPTTIDPPQTGDVAPAGVPLGPPVTTTITPTGGTITTADGGLAITFPPNAVSAPTDVTVQPVTNTAFEGAGRSYRLSPSDVEFAQPVTLRFAYTDADLDGSSPEAMSIAGQDDAGYWHSRESRVVDAAAHAIALDVTTFGLPRANVAAAGPAANDWTKHWTFRIKPDNSPIKLNGTTTVRECMTSAHGADGDPLTEDAILSACKPPDDNSAIPLTNWHVRTSADGTITPSPTNSTWAVYTAPSRDPGDGQGMVWATLQRVVNGRPSPIDLRTTIELDCPWFFAAGGTCTPPNWMGSAHVNNVDGSIIDATFTFEPQPGSMDTYQVQSGQVVITQPPPNPTCTIQISPAQQAIAPAEGMMKLVSQPDGTLTITGMGTTVWLATYTTICPNGTGSMPSGFAAEWWPSPPGGGTGHPVMNNMAEFDTTDGGASGHIIISRVMPGA